MNKEYLRQVEMRSGDKVRIGWVEEDLAKKGKKVRDEDDEQGPVWVVTEVYGRVEREAIDLQAKSHKDFASKLK